MQRNQLTAEQVLSWCNASWDCDGLLALVGDQAVDTPFCAVEGVFGNLFAISITLITLQSVKACYRRTLNHPLPTPESVFASETFLRYAMTGPLWLESITSLGPEVRVWRHVRVAWEPAWTVITVFVLAVGLGPPLQTMSLEVTSVMGYGCVRRTVTGWRVSRDIRHRMRGRGHHRLQRRY